MSPDQKIELKSRLATLSERERKIVVKRAAESRHTAQKAKAKNAAWPVEHWMLHLLQQAEAPVGVEGLVVGVYRTVCNVRIDGEIHRCSYKTELTVGDLVIVNDDAVVDLKPRSTYLGRRDSAMPEHERLIAANIDIVLIVVSVVGPPLHPRLIDRCMAAVRKGGAEPIICVTKRDLGVSDEDRASLAVYERIGVPVVLLSSTTGEGIPELRAMLAGRLAAVVGHSGVGKSTMLNALLEDDAAKTGGVSDASNRGRHTTTSSKLYETAELRLIDTPGIREFGLVFSEPSEVTEAFAEIELHAADCRLAGCLHLVEPNCSVREAVRLGNIQRVRYQSYQKLLAEAFPALIPDELEPAENVTDQEFDCRNCGQPVSLAGGGTKHRNHCPYCLHSLHVDHVPGDRAACCGGVMDPIAVWVRNGGEWALVHRCRQCGILGSNRIAADDNEALLLSLAVRPLSKTPFPLERIGRAS